MSYLDTYLGQLDAALSDPAVMELAINSDGSIWLERAGQIHMTPSGLAALPARSVRDLASQIANSTSNTFTETAPLVSAAVRYRDQRAATVDCHRAGRRGAVNSAQDLRQYALLTLEQLSHLGFRRLSAG